MTSKLYWFSGRQQNCAQQAKQASKRGHFPVSVCSHFNRVTLYPTSGCDTRGVLNPRRVPDRALLGYLHVFADFKVDIEHHVFNISS